MVEKVWKTGKKEFPEIKKLNVFGQTYYVVTDDKGDKHVRKSPLGVQSLIGANSKILKLLEE